MHTVFVYGTLRPHRPGASMQDCRYWFQVKNQILAWMPARLPGAQLVSFGSYPGAYPGAGELHGELLHVTDEGLAEMDRIEGVHDFFQRERVQVVTDRGPKAAWIYWGPPQLKSKGKLIPGGDWLKRSPDDDSRS